MWLCQSGNYVLFNTGDSTPEMGDKKNQEWNVKGSCSGLNMQYRSKLIQEYFPWFLMMEHERCSHWPWNTVLERNYISLKHTRIEELEEKYCALILSFWPQQRPPQLSSHISTHMWTLVRSIALEVNCYHFRLFPLGSQCLIVRRHPDNPECAYIVFEKSLKWKYTWHNYNTWRFPKTYPQNPRSPKVEALGCRIPLN